MTEDKPSPDKISKIIRSALSHVVSYNAKTGKATSSFGNVNPGVRKEPEKHRERAQHSADTGPHVELVAPTNDQSADVDNPNTATSGLGSRLRTPAAGTPDALAATDVQARVIKDHLEAMPVSDADTNAVLPATGKAGKTGRLQVPAQGEVDATALPAGDGRIIEDHLEAAPLSHDDGPHASRSPTQVPHDRAEPDPRVINRERNVGNPSDMPSPPTGMAAPAENPSAVVQRLTDGEPASPSRTPLPASAPLARRLAEKPAADTRLQEAPSEAGYIGTLPSPAEDGLGRQHIRDTYVRPGDEAQHDTRAEPPARPAGDTPGIASQRHADQPPRPARSASGTPTPGMVGAPATNSKPSAAGQQGREAPDDTTLLNLAVSGEAVIRMRSEQAVTAELNDRLERLSARLMKKEK